MKLPRGVIPPLVTPLSARDRLDEAGLERLLEHVLAGGVAGVFLLGTTGEAPSLSGRLRRELVSRACAQVAGRVPVLVGVTDPSLDESLELARSAAAAGAAAIVAAPPYYYDLTQAELTDYYKQLADESPLPLVLYDMPSCTGISIAYETVERLLDHPNIIGLKDSSGDMRNFQRLLHLTRDRDFPLYVGPEELTAQAVLWGAAGGVNGGANLRPRLFTDLIAVAAQGDLALLRPLQDSVLAGSTALYTIGRMPAAVPQGLKTALNLLGICDDCLAPPFRSLDETQRKVIAERLRGLGLEPK